MPFNLAEGETMLSSTQWQNGEVTVTTSRLMFREHDAGGLVRQYLPLEMIDSVRAVRRRNVRRFPLGLLAALVACFLLPVVLFPFGLLALVPGGYLLYRLWRRGTITAIQFHAGDQTLEVYAVLPVEDLRVQELLDAVEAARQSLLDNAAPPAPPAPVRVTLNP